MQKVRCAVRKIPSGNEKYLTSVSIISVYLMKTKSHLLPVPLKIIGMIKQWTTFMSNCHYLLNCVRKEGFNVTVASETKNTYKCFCKQIAML